MHSSSSSSSSSSSIADTSSNATTLPKNSRPSCSFPSPLSSSSSPSSDAIQIHTDTRSIPTLTSTSLNGLNVSSPSPNNHYPPMKKKPPTPSTSPSPPLSFSFRSLLPRSKSMSTYLKRKSKIGPFSTPKTKPFMSMWGHSGSCMATTPTTPTRSPVPPLSSSSSFSGYLHGASSSSSSSSSNPTPVPPGSSWLFVPGLLSSKASMWPSTPSLSLKIHFILTRPQSCKVAHVFNIVFLLFVFLSMMLLAAGSMLDGRPLETSSTYALPLFILEWIFNMFFTIEYTFRLCTWPTHQYTTLLRNFYTWTDVLAILPFWIDQVVTAYFVEFKRYATIWQLFQFSRVLRLLKFTQSSKQIKMASLALTKSRDGIFMLLFIFALSLAVFSSLMYYAESFQCSRNEQGQWVYDAPADMVGQLSAFQSIPEALWWCIVTITTTGYGDVTPKTVLGKIVAGGAMICAVMMFSFPITIFSQSLSDVYQEHRHRQAMLKQFNKRLKEHPPHYSNHRPSSFPSPLTELVMEGSLRSASAALSQHLLPTTHHTSSHGPPHASSSSSSSFLYAHLLEHCLERTEKELELMKTKVDDLHGFIKLLKHVASKPSTYTHPNTCLLPPPS
ncbi:hypothetical protein HMI55_000854 [Coelomomyces lativittatus]|nr:hypothetical protein HMI55_000854 [Coelomomyces lativittatus]KAJ1513033.1 hypothetical protein HMI56_003147 [Coelomomyces lativittatus]